MLQIRKKLIILSLLLVFTACKSGFRLFNPTVLPTDYSYTFAKPYSEFYFPVDKKTKLNGVLIKADSISKGVIFYLHGNSGSVQSTAIIAESYLNNHYDFFLVDYRGFGKSESKIKSEKKMYRDIQIVYDSIKKLYDEDDIIIQGYSIGTGIATELASRNHPKALILIAPYYSLPDLVQQHIKIMPSLFIKYKFRTHKYITQVKAPITIIHGKDDELILVQATYKLKPLLKPQDKVFILRNQKHNRFHENPEFISLIRMLLEEEHTSRIDYK